MASRISMEEGTGFAINYASDEVQSGINNSDFSLGEKTGLDQVPWTKRLCGIRTSNESIQINSGRSKSPLHYTNHMVIRVITASRKHKLM